MKRNVSGQKIGAQLITAADGSAFTGSVTVSVTGDAGTQATGSVGSGACTHEGGGYHTYAPAQAETDYDLVAFTFAGTGAVPVTVQVFTSYPQTGDSFARIGSTGSALTSLATQSSVDTIDGIVDSILLDTAEIGTAGAGLTALASQSSLDTVDGNVDAIKAKTDQFAFTVANQVDANALTGGGSGSGPTAAEIADAVWDETMSGHLTSGTTGASLNGAGSAGDPWTTTLPGEYTSGTAGYILGTNLDATVSTRATQSSVDTVDNFLDTEIAAIKAKTDSLPSDPADASDIATAFSGVNTKLDTIDNFLDTEIAAILTDTGTTIPAQIAALNNLDSTDVQTAAAAALTAYDPPTHAELTAGLASADDSILAAITALSAATVKKNTALSNFTFPMKLNSDHWSAATGKTVTGERSLDGAAYASVSGTIAEVGSGTYQFDAAAADTNGDVITWKFSNADCDDTIVTIKTSA